MQEAVRGASIEHTQLDPMREHNDYDRRENRIEFESRTAQP
jgi:hypothetical protein